MRGRVGSMRVAALCVAAVCVGLAGCASNDESTSTAGKDDSKAAAGSSTTLGVAETTSPDGQPDPTTLDTTPTTVTDGEFEKVTEDLNAAIDAAGNDPCKIIEVLAGQTPAPATAAQTEDAIGVFVNLFTKLADAAPPSEADAAAVVRDLITKLPASAKAVGYDPEKVSSLPELLSSDLTTAIKDITAASKCTG